MSSIVKSLDRAVNEKKVGDGSWIMREWGEPQSDTVQSVILYQGEGTYTQGSRPCCTVGLLQEPCCRVGPQHRCKSDQVAC